MKIKLEKIIATILAASWLTLNSGCSNRVELAKLKKEYENCDYRLVAMLTNRPDLGERVYNFKYVNIDNYKKLEKYKSF